MTPIITIVCVVTGMSCRAAESEDQAESSHSSPPGLSTQADTCGHAVSGSPGLRL